MEEYNIKENCFEGYDIDSIFFLADNSTVDYIMSKFCRQNFYQLHMDIEMNLQNEHAISLTALEMWGKLVFLRNS